MVGAAIEILREQLLALAVCLEVGEQIVEILARHLAIAVPPHGIPGEIIDYRVLVFWATAGVMTGLGAERSAYDQQSFARGDGVFVERRLCQVPVDCGEIFEAKFIGAIRTVPHALLLHVNSSQLSRFMVKHSRILRSRSGILRR